MSSALLVRVDASQHPGGLALELLESLRARRLRHKFLYDGLKQTRKWLALHQAVSPSRNDSDCAAAYDEAFRAAAAAFACRAVHLVGLGCGGGQKDTRSLLLLREAGIEVSYTPVDAGVAMVLGACHTATSAVPGLVLTPIVCDLELCDLGPLLEEAAPAGVPRLLSFLGMIPNFEPGAILPRLSALVGPSDLLLFSANLAPGRNYESGMERILPLYDNAPTREWLQVFLDEVGISSANGTLRFSVEEGRPGLKRIVARFHFAEPVEVRLENGSAQFNPGEELRLFFSYRYTPGLVTEALAGVGLRLLRAWETRSGEEGIYLATKTPAGAQGAPGRG